MADEQEQLVFVFDADTSGLVNGAQLGRTAINGLLDRMNIGARISDLFQGALTRLSKAAKFVAAQFKPAGGAINQLGYQIQDVAITAQMGQSAMQILGQQGSQIASIFGPGGAVIGAILALSAAVGGGLMKALGDGKTGLELLKIAAKDLDGAFEQTQQGIMALSNKYAYLAQEHGELLKAMRDEAIVKYNAAIAAMPKDLDDATKSTTGLWDSITAGLGGGVASLSVFADSMKMLNITTTDYNTALEQAYKTTQQSIGAYQGANTAANSIGATVEAVAHKFGLTNQQAFELTRQLAEFSKSPTPQKAEELAISMEKLRNDTGNTNEEFGAFIKKMFDVVIATAGAERQVKLLDGSIVSLSAHQADAMKTAQQQLELSKLSGKAASHLRAQQDAENEGFKQGSAEFAQYAKMREDFYNQQLTNKSDTKSASQAASQAKQLAKEHENDARKIDDMRASLDLSTESVKKRRIEEAGLRAEQSLSQAASDKERQTIRDLAEQKERDAIATQDRAKALQQAKGARLEIAAAQVATGENPTATIDQQEAEKLAVYTKYQQEDQQNYQLYEDAKTAIQKQAIIDRQKATSDAHQKEIGDYQTFTSGVSDAFGGLADAMAASAGKGSAAYQTAFAIQKGFAIASATLAMYSAAAKALDDWSGATTAGRFALMGSVLAAGGGLLSSISGVSMGGRFNGGPVLGGSAYRVGESNKPEIYKANNGNQYMIPGDSGRVISNRDLGGGGIQQNITFNIQTTGGIDNETMARMALMMKQISLNTIKDQQRPNGLLQRSR